MRNAPANGGARNDVGDQTNVSIMPPLPSEVNSVEFLEWFRPGGPWVLSAIVPDGRITTVTFDQTRLIQMRQWLSSRDGAENLYFQVNSSGDKRLNSKASKDDIVAADWLHVDIDGDKAAILPRLEAFRLRPSAVVDSGGGYQAFWRIAATDELDDVEAINRWLAAELGGDHCHNIDRIMRLPGTMNLPNKKKAKAGRVPVLASVVWLEDRLWDRAEFGRVADEGTATPVSVGEELAEVSLAEIHDFLPPTAVKHAMAKPEGSRNEDAFSYMLACAAGKVPDEIALGFALHPDLPISDYYLRESSGKLRSDPIAQARKDLAKAHGNVATEQPKTAAKADFARDKDGRPYADLGNLRIALDQLNLPLWYDEFADRFWLGADQLTDHRERNLRLVEVPRLGLSYPKGGFSEFISQIAWENRRHPLREKLSELVWDGQPRIETFLIDWAEAEDNEYVRTVTRLWFLAGARRALKPGVKFDELMILESPQGGLKSSAMAKLAFGPEWFTDGLPLSGDSKIAIEQTQGKWICEAADMQGKSSDDNRLKAFLSRTHDRARLAYDRRAADVPRSWIPIGTTNDSHYLKDPTGNRRFWPVRIGVFSLGFDPDLLWAEAVARQDESIRMPKELWTLAAEQQSERAQSDPWGEEIARRLGDAEIVLAADVWRIVGVPLERQTQKDNDRLGGIMRKLGYERKRLRHGGRPEYHYVRGEEQRRFYFGPDDLQGDMPF